MFKEKFHPKIKKDIKKLDKSLVKKLPSYFDQILSNPHQNEQLKGNLKDIFSYHFQHQSTNYRIAYTINNDNEIVIFLLIASRENFYKNVALRI
jgi:addiction module RelE/StbE family toxin